MTIEIFPGFINANDINDAWFQVLSHIYNHGRKYTITSGSFAGDIRLEGDFISGIIRNPHSRPLAPIMPEGTNLSPPTTDEKINEYFAKYIMDPKLEPNEEYRYSSWINGNLLELPKYCRYINCNKIIKYSNDESSYCRTDENNYKDIFDLNDICPLNKPRTAVEWIINHFKTNGFGTNHCYINVGDKHSILAYDRLFSNEAERGTSPCLRGLDFKIKDNTLYTSVVFRSWDAYAGFPENLGGISLLNEYIAGELEIEPGPLIFNSTGLHCYGYQLDIVKKRLGKE